MKTEVCECGANFYKHSVYRHGPTTAYAGDEEFVLCMVDRFVSGSILNLAWP